MQILDCRFESSKILLTSLKFRLELTIKQIHNFNLCFVALLSNNALQMVCDG